MSSQSWEPGKYLADIQQKRQHSATQLADVEKRDAMRNMAMLAQQALGIQKPGDQDATMRVSVGPDGVIDKAQVTPDFRVINYVRNHMAQVREQLNDPDSALAERFVERDGSDLTADGKTLFEKARVVEAYFTPEAYGAALTDIVLKQGDVEKLEDSTKELLRTGPEAVEALEEFFRLARSDYSAVRMGVTSTLTDTGNGSHTISTDDVIPSNTDLSDSDAHLLVAAVDTLAAPIRHHHGQAVEKPAEKNFPMAPFVIMSTNTFGPFR